MVTTHCHWDHIGWNFSGEGVIRFRLLSRTRSITFAKNDWTYYSDPANDNDEFNAYVAPLEGTGQLKLVLGELELMEG